METREYLKQVRKYRSMIQHKQETLQRNALDAQAAQALKQEIAQYTALQKEAIRLFERLPLRQYELMYQIYILGLTLQDAADRADRTYSWATTEQGRAIKALQKMMEDR